MEAPPKHSASDTVIYETHVRGFTIYPSSGAAHPGTFIGATEKIPYLQDLGVAAIELMPVLEFNENESNRLNPITREKLRNYWGYIPVAFFAPKQILQHCRTAPVADLGIPRDNQGLSPRRY